MQPADHAGSAVDDLLKLLHRLETDALLSRDLLQVERFAERAAKVLPHGGGDPLALGLRKLGESDGQIAQRALLPVEARGDEPPGEARGRRHGFERQCGGGGLGGPESDIFQPVAKGFRDNHRSARNRRQGRGG